MRTHPQPTQAFYFNIFNPFVSHFKVVHREVKLQQEKEKVDGKKVYLKKAAKHLSHG